MVVGAIPEVRLYIWLAELFLAFGRGQYVRMGQAAIYETSTSQADSASHPSSLIAHRMSTCLEQPSIRWVVDRSHHGE